MTAPIGQTRIDPKDPRFNERVAEWIIRLQNGEIPLARVSLAGAEDVPIRFVDSDVTLFESDRIVISQAAGAITVTLPSARDRRRRVTIKKASTGNVTVAAAGTDTIEGAASVALTAGGAFIALIADANGTWYDLY